MATTRRWVPLLLVPWFLGCATTTHAVQLNTGTGRPIVYRPPAPAKPVLVGQREFVEVVSRLMLELPLSLAPEGELGRVRFAAFQAGTIPRSVLHLDGRERQELALSYALDSVWQGVAVAVNATINPVALKAMISSALCAYMLLVVAPEPVTKFIAIALTAYLVAYVGFEALWNMVEAFRQLRDEAARATSFAQLEQVGHRFGVVMGDNGARVLIMALLAAAGGRAGLAAKGPTLPGYAQAAFAAEAQAGFSLTAVAAGGVQSLSISASGLLVGLTPAAVASVAWKEGGGSASPEPDASSQEGIGATRAARFGANWKRVSLRETVERIAGASPRVTMTPSGKTIYSNPNTGLQVVYDQAGNYFRVENPAASGPLRYLDEFGKPIPANVSAVGPNGTTLTGVPKDVRNALTHFLNSD